MFARLELKLQAIPVTSLKIVHLQKLKSIKKNIAVAISRHWSTRNQESWLILFRCDGEKVWDKQFKYHTIDFLFSENESVAGGWDRISFIYFRVTFKYNEILRDI